MSALKVAYTFKVCEEYNNFQDSKLIFMISDFDILLILLLIKLKHSVLVARLNSTVESFLVKTWPKKSFASTKHLNLLPS